MLYDFGSTFILKYYINLIQNLKRLTQTMNICLHQLPTVKKIFDTNVIVQKCPHPDFYDSKNIISKLLNFVQQFEEQAPEQRGKAHTSSTAYDNCASIAHFDYIQPLMNWIGNTVWHNRYHLQGGFSARGITVSRNWINEMYKGCSAIEHMHPCPVAVFYIRLPENGTDMVFTNGEEHISAGVRQGDLLIHDRGINHMVSEHKSDITRICLVVEFDFIH